MTSETQKLVIFDTDMGSDDLGIANVFGNTTTENIIKNTYRILDGLGRTDIPMYKGASDGIIPFNRKQTSFHGVNGFSGVEFWQPHYPSDIDSLVQSKSAIQIIRDLVMEHPHEISLIAVGPLTNIALALKAFPEIKDNIKDVFIMGGNHKGRGNIVNGAEFNFHADPIAAHIVLNTLKCPLNILTFECGLPGSISISLDWRFDVLGNSNCANVQLLNEIERIAFGNRKLFTPFDALLTAVFLFPERCIQTKIQYRATVELEGVHTRGQMVIDMKNTDYNVTVIETMNEEEFKKALQWTATA